MPINAVEQAEDSDQRAPEDADQELHVPPAWPNEARVNGCVGCGMFSLALLWTCYAVSALPHIFRSLYARYQRIKAPDYSFSGYLFTYHANKLIIYAAHLAILLIAAIHIVALIKAMAKQHSWRITVPQTRQTVFLRKSWIIVTILIFVILLAFIIDVFGIPIGH